MHESIESNIYYVRKEITLFNPLPLLHRLRFMDPSPYLRTNVLSPSLENCRAWPNLASEIQVTQEHPDAASKEWTVAHPDVDSGGSTVSSPQ